MGGAHICVETLAAGNVKEQVASCVLIAPGDLIEQARDQIGIPALLLWARDDEVAEFREAQAWLQALHGWRSVFYAKDVKTGGHNFANVLSKDKEENSAVAHALVRFTIVTLVIAGLNALSARHHSDLDEDGALMLPDWLGKILHELPQYIAALIGGAATDDKKDEGAVAAVVAEQLRSANAEKVLRRTVSQLKEWIRGGMHQVASATE